MRRWETTYKGHEIRIEAGIFSKRLFIDGKLKAVSGLSASTQLVAIIEAGQGAGESVIAKLSGLWPSRCDVVTNDDALSQESERDPQAVMHAKARAFHVIRGEGPTRSDAWKEVFEEFRRKFPNLASYDDEELRKILQESGVKFTQTFGQKPRVETNLDNQTHLDKPVLETILQLPRKDSR